MSAGSTRILLVEDNPADARMLREALREVPTYQCDLVHVERLSMALQRLGEEHFDTILLDLSLPDAKGLDTVVRVLDTAPRVPILVLTGLDDEDVAVRALRVGAQDYLIKGQTDGYLLVRAMRYASERQYILQANKKYIEETRLNLARMRALREIDHAVTSTLDLYDILEVLLEKIGKFVPFAAGCVLRLDRENRVFEPIVYCIIDETEFKTEEYGAACSLVSTSFEMKAPLTISNLQTNPYTRDIEFFGTHGLVSFLGIPLDVRGQSWGVISLYMKEEREFKTEELEFLTALAAQTAVAIHNAELYEELAKLAADLSRSNQVKEEFLGVMSHELRTPLNVVMGCAEMMMQGCFGEITPEQEKVLEKLLAQVNHQLRMINNILQATQIETEKPEVLSHEVDLKEFLDNLKAGYEPFGLEKDINLCWGNPSGLPMVITDEDKLRQILENIINNAIKFTKQGSVTISAMSVEDGGQQANGQGRQRFVQFKVVDTGVGISGEAVPLIFEKFYQADSSSTRLHQGVGLGLYIVKKFTALLGGKVEVKSEVGKGSTFTITVPAAKPNEATDMPEASSPLCAGITRCL